MSNETYIFESPWIFTGQLMAVRIVAYKKDNATFPERPYVTHIEVDPKFVNTDLKHHGQYKVHGNYDMTFDEAIEDAKNRYQNER